MAQRVATEYVNANLTVPETDMPRLLALCGAQQLRLQVFVLENGNQEVVLEDDAGGESIRLTFERSEGNYRCRLTCRVVQPKLTNVLRKMVSAFKGDAVVNRIYEGFTMVYHYMQGAVIRIAECKGNAVRTVFEYRDTLGRMEAQFQLCSVEEEIGRLKQSVNELLDRRNRAADPGSIREIDERLKYHSRLLFVLEA
ncbi:non-ribosomal peptide synthetase module [Cohnella candidum]|uniref:Non-ribosomal peptide synthetase module n=1 Tax=Cohnella candidum TaxID=2674991 RepID=A0A3G3JYA5_9BACL|nr:non-ribosomal peptide synthetase module [Cohnella candidum]AYQ73230.1 non-ribosomal peptide synthetase module [Cohnella candidum]